MQSNLNIQLAQKSDVALIFNLIKQFATENGSLENLTGNEVLLENALFGSEPTCKVLLGYINGTPVSYALYLKNFSTLLCKPGIYLVDLFVIPDARKCKVATRMVAWLGNFAFINGYGRLEWSVHKDNLAAINLYEKLGAKSLEEWKTYRVTGVELENLGD